MTRGSLALLCAAAFVLATTPAKADESEKQDAGPGPVPYVVLASGATLAAASAVFQLVAVNEDSDANQYFWHSTREDLSPSTRAALAHSSDSHFDAAKVDQAVAITCGILAVAAVSAAVTWLLVSRH